MAADMCCDIIYELASAFLKDEGRSRLELLKVYAGCPPNTVAAAPAILKRPKSTRTTVSSNRRRPG